MTNLYVFIQIFWLFVKNVHLLPCPQSRQTMSPVLSCPRNEVEWKQRSDEKNCFRVQQQCPEAGDSVYHCVLNSFVNETLEVCAPEVRIIGSRCVEYNLRGAIIQESPYVKCNGSCPFSYTSTTVYKYHECFRSVERKTSDLRNATSLSRGCAEKRCDYSTQTSWQIVAVVIICMNIAFFLVILWTVMSKRKLEKKLTQQEEERLHLLGTCTRNEKQNKMEDTGTDITSIKREDADGSPDEGKEKVESTEQFHVKQGVGVDWSLTHKKMVGLGSDGAAVMTGKKTSVAALMKEHHPSIISIHCLAHRLELAYKDALKGIKVAEKVVSGLLLGLYYFYHNSPLNRANLKESYKTLGIDMKMPTRVGGTRWVGHVLLALKNMFHGYAAIKEHLYQLAFGSGVQAIASGKKVAWLIYTGLSTPVFAHSTDFLRYLVKPPEQIELKDDNTKGIYVAALDIGDHYLTMALAYPDSYHGVKPIGSVERISIFREENEKFKPFSTEDLAAFAKKDKEATASKYHYQFKLSKESSNERDYRGVLKAVLERFNYALENGKENVKNVAKEHLYYTFIVPSYWTDNAITRLRKTILEMKIIQDMDPQKIYIISRKDTLSPFIQYANARVLCLNFKVGNLVLDTSKDAVYGILHIGSHYCDLTFRLVGNDQLPDLRKQRFEWAILPEEKILHLMSEIFTERVFKDWKNQYENSSIFLISEFEKNIKSCGGCTDGVAFEMALPETLVKLAKENHPLKESDIKKSIEKRKNICLKTSEDWIIQFQNEFVRECFQEMGEKVVRMIDDAKETFKERNVKCVVMTGTYSNMEIIRTEAEKRWFKKFDLEVTIAIPEDYQVFAMGGAYCLQNKLKQEKK